jgi:4-carboxymuconolactone decarboxylase
VTSDRLPLINERSQLPPDAAIAWDTIVGSRGGVRGPYQVLLNSPTLAMRVSELSSYLRFDSRLDPRVRELAIVATGYALNCPVVHDSHRPFAIEAGVPAKVLDDVRLGAIDELPMEMQLIARLVRDLLVDHRTTDEIFGALREQLGPRNMTDLVATIGYYSLIGCILNSVDSAQRAPRGDG